MSRIQKIMDAARERQHPGREPSAWRSAPVTALSGLFRGLRATRLESQVLEENKLLPGIEDRRAITAYKMLRTRVLHRMRANQWHTLVVTSAGPGEGKTLTACNLAVSIANDVNQAVMLVDLDLQRPTMAEYFGIAVRAGMGDYLLGNAAPEEIVYAPEGLERILIVPNREPVENSSELLASPRMQEFVAWAKDPGRGAVIVFDMPPVLVCDDVLAFAPNADAMLIVAAEAMTNRTALQDTLETLGEYNLLGVVLNRSAEQSGTSDYYGYYY